MKFQNRCLGALIYLIPTIVVLGILYVGSYFIAMEKSFACNPRTLLPEYPTANRFVKSERVSGDISIYITPTHWSNRLFSPLDKIFRRNELVALEHRRNELIEFRKSH